MINAAVIGVGRLGPVHVNNLLRIPTKVNIVAICDLKEDRADYYAKISNSKPYTDYKKMLEKEKIDAVFVITETHNHYDIVIDCAKAGKNIFCEKPIAETLEKAKKIKEIVSKMKIKFQVGYMRRFDPAYSQAYKMIEEGKIGKLLMFKSTSRDPFAPPEWACDPKMGGGLYMDMHTHDFDLARWFMKDEVGEVFVNDSNLLNLKYDIPNLKDNTIISIRFNNGSLSVIDGNWNAVGGYDVRSEISGSNGFITVGQLHYQPITLFSEGGLTNVSTYQTVNNNPHFMYRFGEAYFLEDESFINNINENKEPLINVNDGFEAIRIADAAQRSSDNKCIVKL